MEEIRAASRLRCLRIEGDFSKRFLPSHLLAQGRGLSGSFWGVEEGGSTRWKKLSFLNRSARTRACLKITLDGDINKK